MIINNNEMKTSLQKILKGYQLFRKKYTHGDQSIMYQLSHYGQQPKIMVIACCDSRVDPALILQCNPGDLFVVRNVANIVPHYEKDEAHHGTSAALEFGVRCLEIKHLILLGHSQCGGIQELFKDHRCQANDFITKWVSLIKTENNQSLDVDEYSKIALQKSYQNCLTFPWIREKIEQEKIIIHLWFFDIKSGQIYTYSDTEKSYKPLDSEG